MRERNREQRGEGEWHSKLVFKEGEEIFWVSGLIFHQEIEIVFFS